MINILQAEIIQTAVTLWDSIKATLIGNLPTIVGSLFTIITLSIKVFKDGKYIKQVKEASKLSLDTLSSNLKSMYEERLDTLKDQVNKYSDHILEQAKDIASLKLERLVAKAIAVTDIRTYDDLKTLVFKTVGYQEDSFIENIYNAYIIPKLESLKELENLF